MSTYQAPLKDMKFVLRNCKFDGADGFNLARHHADGQFYFLDCTFARTMSGMSAADLSQRLPFLMTCRSLSHSASLRVALCAHSVSSSPALRFAPCRSLRALRGARGKFCCPSPRKRGEGARRADEGNVLFAPSALDAVV